jgi:hypothetical protein
MPNDHYVPQFLLRGFAVGKRKQLYAFDKRDGRFFHPSIRNLACEQSFYEPQEDKGLSGLDSWIEQAETAIAPMIQQIRARESLDWLIPAQRKWIAAFTVLQILRTPNHREICADVNKEITDALTKMGADPYNIENFRPLTDAQLHDSSLADIRDLTLELYPHVLDKSWLLLEADGCGPFWISDNPVVMYNTLNPGDGIRGTLGLRVNGIEIYLPISSRLTLGFLCSAFRTHFRSVVQSDMCTHPITTFYWQQKC